jgi:hypothetical protein
VRSVLPSATQLGLLVAALALALGAFGPAAAAPSASGTPTDHGAKLGAKIDALGEVPPAASPEPAAPPPASSSSS